LCRTPPSSVKGKEANASRALAGNSWNGGAATRASASSVKGAALEKHMQELAREEGPDASCLVRMYAALDKVLSRSSQRRALKLECANKHAEKPR